MLAWRNEGCITPKSEKNLALAQKYYQLRYEELQQLILAEESAFKTILREIEDIKAGKWDKQLEFQLTGKVSASQESLPAATVSFHSDSCLRLAKSRTQSRLPAEIGGGEAFSGSLSGASSREAPPPTEMWSAVPLGPQTDPELPQLVANEVQECAVPNTAGIMGTQNEEDIFKEGIQVDPTTDSSVMTDTTDLRTDEDSTGQSQSPREEEEEEEEEEEPENESEDEKSEHDGTDIERDISEEQTASGEHRQEEDLIREPGNVTEDKQMVEGGAPPVPPEDQAQEVIGEMRQQAEDEPVEEQEPVQLTRRSTRNRPLVPAPPITRKTRRQTRASEPGIHSDAEGDDVEAEYHEDERISSPVPVEPINTRRRKRKSSIPEPLDSPRDRKKQRDESEPIDDDEPGPSAGVRRRRSDRSEEQLALKKFQNMISMLHSQITQHRNGNIFHSPIRTVEAPDYHDIVKRPMDLKTIKARVKDGLIANSLEYQRDCFLMFANAMMYNPPGSDVYHMAEDATIFR
ncbi:hypothetical protein Ac2012v2_004142 [Leucoagaricus gongylophorus]